MSAEFLGNFSTAGSGHDQELVWTVHYYIINNHIIKPQAVYLRCSEKVVLVSQLGREGVQAFLGVLIYL